MDKYGSEGDLQLSSPQSIWDQASDQIGTLWEAIGYRHQQSVVVTA